MSEPITYPRKRHSHRCPVCRNAVACYRKQCAKPQRITIEQCPYHRPVKSSYELIEPEKMPFNLQGETLQNEANNEGKARAQAQAAADQRKAQPGLWDERSKTFIKPSGTVKQGRRPMFEPYER